VIVKICGVTIPEDAAGAVLLGADLVGMVLVEGSSRQVTPEVARDIVLAVGGEVRTVGVFADADPDEIQRIRRIAGFDIVQLHGNETPEFCENLSKRVGGRIIKAFRGSLGGTSSYQHVFARLFDAPEPGAGREWNWGAVARAPRDRPVVLAGGLTPENLVRAVGLSNPDGVDVSTGVEFSPGVKDLFKVQAFIAAARALPGEMKDEPEPGIE